MEKSITNIKCQVCGKIVTSLHCCGRCNSPRYCSRECQKSDWPTHKQHCLTIENIAELLFTKAYLHPRVNIYMQALAKLSADIIVVVCKKNYASIYLTEISQFEREEIIKEKAFSKDVKLIMFCVPECNTSEKKFIKILGLRNKLDDIHTTNMQYYQIFDHIQINNICDKLKEALPTEAYPIIIVY
jgi:hypothetical protein